MFSNIFALPDKGNRNSLLTLVGMVLPIAAWTCRGFASGDWTGLEWVCGAVAAVSAASSHRARGEYAYVEENVEKSDG